MRVIGGIAKGRTLVAPRGLAVRPTSDKVREAIFSILGAQALRRAHAGEEGGSFPYRRVLDLFAGTGALGIEALSRGAERADFVEPSARARAAIRENLRRTELSSRGAIHAMRARAALSTFAGPYDLILLDPPYNDPTAPEILETLGHSALLGAGAIVVLEHARSRSVAPRAGRLYLTQSKHYGTTAVSLFEPAEGEPAKHNRLAR